MRQTSTSGDLRVSVSTRLAETQDGAVLLDIQQGLCFSVNPLGTVIWKLICDGHPETQIAEHLVSTFGISEEQARGDTDEFLRVLIEKRLVERLDHQQSQNRRRGWWAKTFSRIWESR